MKKLLTFILTLTLLTPLSACSSSSNKTSTPEKETQTNQQSSADEQLEADEKELSALGDVAVENGILTVSITIPATYESNVTQEALDQAAGDTYLSAKLNDDGSVTYKMTKIQHARMLKQLKDGIDSASQEMINNEQYSFTDIKHNEDCTQFDVTISSSEVSLYDSFAVLTFYVYGGMYGIFSGHPAEKVVVNYYDPSGNLIESADSSQLENTEQQ